jgi:hypothetical protein
MATDKLYGLHVLFQNRKIWDESNGDRIAALKAHIESAAALGVEVIRFPGDWRMLEESGREQYSQWYIDEVKAAVAHAASLGIKVTMMLGQTPYWATDKSHPDGSPEAVWAPPTGSAATDYAAAMVKLHDELKAAGLVGAVVGWEVWNEPNVEGFWSGTKLREGTDVQVDLAAAADYVKLLNATYDAMKAADPKAVILGGSLAGCDADYLQVMYDLGARFDALAIHPYAKANPFNGGVAYDPDEMDTRDVLSQTWSFKHGVEKIRDLMIANGDASTSMWFTEFGWSSDGLWGGAGSAQKQAAFLAEALATIKTWDFVDAAIAYRLFDGANEYFGMRNADGSLKPSGEVFRDFVTSIEGQVAAFEMQGFAWNGLTRTGSFSASTTRIDTSLDDLNSAIKLAQGENAFELSNIVGSRFADTLIGDDARNVISGQSGADKIFGGSGNDHMRGGLGGDKLKGGSGRDIFDFDNVKDSLSVSSLRDHILDFQRGEDRIDLRTIDANEDISGNQRFRWIGESDFTDRAGELRIKETQYGIYVSGDVDGNGSADFSLLVKGINELFSADILV